MAEQPEANQPQRGIEGIAHHFLSSMNQRPAGSKRQSPPPTPAPPNDKPIQPSPPQHVEPDSLKNETTIDSESAIKPPANELARLLLISDHLDGSDEEVNRFVAQMAAQEGPMGLLDLAGAQIRLSEFQAESEPACAAELIDESINSAWEELFGGDRLSQSDKQGTLTDLPGQLTALQQRVEALVVHVSQRGETLAESLIAQCDQVIFLCGLEQKALLKTYQAIKRLAGAVPKGKIVSVYIFGSNDEEQAIEVYEKLVETAEKFLDRNIEWAGFEQGHGPVEQTPLAVSQADRENVEVIKSFFGIGLGQKEAEATVVDNTETAGEINEGCLEKQAPANVQQDDILQEVTSKPVGDGMEVFEPLVVVELPRGDGELADLLAERAGCWLKGTEGVMRLQLPVIKELDDRVRVLIDGQGRLSILLAGLGAAEDYLYPLLEARRWIRSHLTLLQGFSGQIGIDEIAEIKLVLVGGGPGEGLSEVCGQLDYDFMVKRVYLTANSTFKAVLVV